MRQWSVQVAALAYRKDAEHMATGLRQAGYDAYVITAETDNKTWHRVRVGQFSDLGAAKRLRESLIDDARFKQAYVALNN